MSPKVLLIRRRLGKSGGAETVFAKYKQALATDCCDVQTLTEAADAKGPSWLRAILFAQKADKVIASNSSALSISLERGPVADVYRAGDGVHKVWRRLLGGFSLNPLHWVNPMLERKSMEAAKAIIANSKMVDSQIRRHYGKSIADKVRVVYNSFDPQKFAPTDEPKIALRQRLGLPSDSVLFLFPASGWKRKGLAHAAHITHLCADIGAQLVVVGKGNTDDLPKAAIYKGVVDNMAEYYQAADAVILPTLYDPFSNVVLEALACGCLAVTTAQNGASEVIRNGTTGFVMDKPHLNHKDAAYWLKTHIGADVHEIAATVAMWTLDHEISAIKNIFNKIREKKLSSDAR